MIASASKKKLFKHSVGWVVLLCSSCALFQTELPGDDPKSLMLEPCKIAASPLTHNQSWFIQLKYQGISAPLVTARTPWGSPLRYLYPYMRQSQLFELTLENTGLTPLKIDPAQIKLRHASQEQQPLGLEDFKRYWPGARISNTETMLDRAAAMGEVTRTLFGREPILPGTVHKGLLVFTAFTPRSDEQIQILIPTPEPSLNKDFLSFCWQPTPKVKH